MRKQTIVPTIFIIAALVAASFIQPVSPLQATPAGLSFGDWTYLDNNNYLYMNDTLIINSSEVFRVVVAERTPTVYYWLLDKNNGFNRGFLRVNNATGEKIENYYLAPQTVVNDTITIRAKVITNGITLNELNETAYVNLNYLVHYYFENYTTTTINGTDIYVMSYIFNVDQTTANGTVVVLNSDGSPNVNATYVNGKIYNENGTLIGNGVTYNYSRIFYSPGMSMVVRVNWLPIQSQTQLKLANQGLTLMESDRQGFPNINVIEAYIKNYYEWSPYEGRGVTSVEDSGWDSAYVYFFVFTTILAIIVALKLYTTRKK